MKIKKVIKQIQRINEEQSHCGKTLSIEISFPNRNDMRITVYDIEPNDKTAKTAIFQTHVQHPKLSIEQCCYFLKFDYNSDIVRRGVCNVYGNIEE